jgi:hypothetical protein
LFPVYFNSKGSLSAGVLVKKAQAQAFCLPSSVFRLLLLSSLSLSHVLERKSGKMKKTVKAMTCGGDRFFAPFLIITAKPKFAINAEAHNEPQSFLFLFSLSFAAADFLMS